MNDSIKIPVALQIRIDDVAWHTGSDDRHMGLPSRTGMPRRHCAADYPIINELGKALNMKISCAIVLGEWDKDNILRNENCFTWEPETWDRASKIDLDYHRQAFEQLESSEYIDYTIHGVMHGHYDKGYQITEKEFYTCEYDDEKGTYTGKHTWQTPTEFRKHLDFFFKLYHSWGFQKKIKSFACGNGAHGSPWDEGNVMYAGILKEYGVDVWPNGWGSALPTGGIAVVDGMVIINGNPGVVAWNAYDVNPDYLPLMTEENARADFGFHWPNFLRWNPESNLEYLPKWVDYFKRQAEVFGLMLSRDVIFAASQVVYHNFAKLHFEDKKCIIDLKDVDTQQARALKNEFYISLKKGLIPQNITGGTIREYETHNEFTTYQITRNDSDQIILNF